MRIFNTEYKEIDADNVDKTSGYLTNITVIRKDVIPIDNIHKYAYADDDYEQAQMYVPYPTVATEPPTQLDTISAQMTYTAMQTDTLLNSTIQLFTDESHMYATVAKWYRQGLWDAEAVALAQTKKLITKEEYEKIV